MDKKFNLKVGQEVRFRPTHHKNLELTGTITEINDDHDVITVEAQPDGKAIEVAREFQAHAADVTVLNDAPKKRGKSDNAA
jgi:transcription antitermination factor NusG